MYLEDAIIADNIKPVSNIPPARNSSLVQGWVNKFNDISSKLHCTPENVTEQQKNAEKHSIAQDPAVEYPAYLAYAGTFESITEYSQRQKSPCNMRKMVSGKR